MSALKVDEKVLFFLTPTVKDEKKSKKDGDLLTPQGAKKPLALTKQQIGRHTWALLHSMAVSYPNEPTDEEKEKIKNFMYGLAYNFPCKICGSHLLKMLDKEGVKANSREEFVGYICKIHNIVNKVLNKTQFDCKEAFEIWGGDCRCDDN